MAQNFLLLKTSDNYMSYSLIFTFDMVCGCGNTDLLGWLLRGSNWNRFWLVDSGRTLCCSWWPAGWLRAVVRLLCLSRLVRAPNKIWKHEGDTSIHQYHFVCFIFHGTLLTMLSNKTQLNLKECGHPVSNKPKHDLS